MTAARAVEILENEKACVLRANTCGRNCAKCDLVLPDAEILEAYNMTIEELKGGEQRNVKTANISKSFVSL